MNTPLEEGGVNGVFTPKGPSEGAIDPFVWPACGAGAQPSATESTTKPACQGAVVPSQGE